MKFKIGDRVEHEYFGKGTVIQEDSKDIFLVEFDRENSCLHNGNGKGKDYHCWSCKNDELKLVKFTKSDLKEGDKVTLRSGSIGFYKKDERIASLSQDKIRDDLTNKGNLGEILDIVKVERPIEYKTVFEREEEPKEMTLKEVCDALGYDVKIVKEDE